MVAPVVDVARYADGTGRPESRQVFLGYGMARDGYAKYVAVPVFGD